MSVAFSSDDSDPIKRKIENFYDDGRRDESFSIEDMYEIEKCSEWIKTNNFCKVALQFPDSMLGDAANVVKVINHSSDASLFILGDTSYGNCCVDEVAAEHISADAIIHFGHACLSPTKRLPVLYVFGKQVIDVQAAAKSFTEFFPDRYSQIIILYDVMCHHAIGQLSALLMDYKNFIVSQLEIPGKNVNLHSDDGTAEFETITKCHRVIRVPSGTNLADYKIFYIGSRAITLTNFMLAFKKCSFYSYNPCKNLSQLETLNVNKHLQKRYYYIEKAKDARIIGILVGTLGVSNYLAIIKHLKELIKQSGKKSYTLAVGKINNAKLANFSEIEVFVNVACEEASLIESREFYQSIVTPYELEIALNPAREWTGDYITDFSEILPGAVCVSNENADESDVSLITGKLRHRRLSDHETNEISDETSLMTRNDMKIASIHSGGAGEYLAERSWKGLEQHLGSTAGAVEQGQKGIASMYEDEKDVKDS